jgi:hypothetical protein
MAKVNLEGIQPGMILEKDVKERSGRVLLRAGTEITGRHLNILKTWGVAEADIKDVTQEQVNAQAAQQFDPQALKEAEERMEQLFLHVDRSQAAVRELIRLCVVRQVRAQARVQGG